MTGDITEEHGDKQWGVGDVVEGGGCLLQQEALGKEEEVISTDQDRTEEGGVDLMLLWTELGQPELC